MLTMSGNLFFFSYFQLMLDVAKQISKTAARFLVDNFSFFYFRLFYFFVIVLITTIIDFIMLQLKLMFFDFYYSYISFSPKQLILLL